MWPEIFEFIRMTVAVMCTSAAIKLVDDYLDVQQDRDSGLFNWVEVLGQGILVYAMLLLVIGGALHTQLSLSLFLASYIVGMFNDLNKLFPSRLNGWGECLFVAGIGILIFGFHQLLFSLCFVISVQLADDCIDLQIDRLAGRRNLAYRAGVPTCLLLGAIFLLLTWYIDETLILPVLTGSVFVYLISFYGYKVKVL